MRYTCCTALANFISLNKSNVSCLRSFIIYSLTFIHIINATFDLNYCPMLEKMSLADTCKEDYFINPLAQKLSQEVLTSIYIDNIFILLAYFYIPFWCKTSLRLIFMPG